MRGVDRRGTVEWARRAAAAAVTERVRLVTDSRFPTSPDPDQVDRLAEAVR